MSIAGSNVTYRNFLSPLLGALEEVFRVGQQRAVLEPEVDVLPLRADPGEVPDLALLRQGVGDPAPAGPDGLDRARDRLEDQRVRSARPVSRMAGG